MIALSVPDLHSGERVVAVVEPLKGSSGGNDRHDGGSGNDADAADIKNTPVESIETHIPVVIERYELVPDSAGAGYHRGGWATRLQFRILRPDSVVTARAMERCRFEPWGLGGGRAAGRTQAWLNYGRPGEQSLGRIDILRLDPGDVVTIQSTGGGGYGDPLERDPHAVLQDVLSGLLSSRTAAAEYGVSVVDGGIDVSASRELRLRMREKRGAIRPTDIDFGPSRLAYDSVLPRETADVLVQLLFSLPHSLRPWAKRAIHEAVAQGVQTTPILPVELRELWSRIILVSNHAERKGEVVKFETA